MLDSIAIERYEQFVLGKRRISLNGSKAEKEIAAKCIIHYIVEDLLGWSAADAEEHMTQEIVSSLNIDKVFKYIHFPPDIIIEKDLDYIACLAYPEHNYDVKKQILRVYRRILRGLDDRFPKKIFDGSHGREKAAVLLNEFINTNFVVSSIDDLYAIFSDMPKINYEFKKAKIFAAAKKLYSTPLDFLHYSLSEDERDTFLYGFYQYCNVAKIAESAMNRGDQLFRPEETE